MFLIFKFFLILIYIRRKKQKPADALLKDIKYFVYGNIIEIMSLGYNTNKHFSSEMLRTFLFLLL